MRSKALELEIRMSRKPNISGKGRLHVHDGVQADTTASETKGHGMAEKPAEEEKDI